MAYLIEKDSPSEEILRLFEKTRVAYLSARTDPKEYGGRWRKSIEDIQDLYDNSSELGEELKNFIEKDDIENKEAADPTSNTAEKVYEGIKNMRMASDYVSDPFAKKLKGNVLEELLGSPELMIKFVHYAMRSDNKALSPDIYDIKDMEPDDITGGLQGLDLQEEDIALYIIEQYGDGKDSKAVEKKVKTAIEFLELLYSSKHQEEEWDDLVDIDGVDLTKSEEEKSQSDFIIPNKPMYRIFDIEDMNELRGFSGEYIVQEKYDGMRIQIHKIDKKVTVYSYNEKDITNKCKEIVNEMKKKHFGDCILDGELILFDGDEALHRADTISHVFKNKYPEATLKAHMFDIMRHNDKALLDEPLQQRLNTMFNNYSIHSSDALNFPSKKDTRMADSLKDIEEYAKIIMEMPTSEGVVIKDATSTYFQGTKKNPKWIKWKKFVDLDFIVLDKKKTKSKLYSYTLGAGPIDDEEEGQELNGKKYMNVGKALNTKISVSIGDIVRVKVDEVKESNGKYTVFSAKVIEVPEVDAPEKIVTLEMLSKDTKKSLNYSVEALTKGIKITDHIHGEASVIIKGDMNGFTIYGFEEHNLMSKNALADLDMWKTQAEEIMKTKQSKIIVAIFNYLKKTGDKTPQELHKYLIGNKFTKDLYEDLLESKSARLKDWLEDRGKDHGVLFRNNKFVHDPNKIMAEIKKYETPEEYQEGEFKIYLRDDENLNLVIKLKKETLNWFIDLEEDEDIFNLFGKATKYPAMVAKDINKKKVIDEGKIKLGVQRSGYHEYFLEGNKFETKIHFRVVPANDGKMWIAWTGYKQSPADKDKDKGLWNIYEDGYNELPLPTK
jgi:hypothetical protein